MTTSKVLTTGAFILLILILGIVESATDMYVPSLPLIALDFATSAEAVALTVSAYFFAFCIMAPIYGPLSDALGRRRVLLFGLLMFTMCSLLCVFADTIGMFIFLRFLQGAGAAVGWVIGLAIIKDTTDTQKSVSMLSMMHTVVALAPAIAPILGGYVGSFWHWRATFGIMATGALLIGCFSFFCLKETLPPSRRHPLSLRSITTNYQHLLGNKKFLGYAFISGLLFAGWMINVAMTPFYYVDCLGVPACYFGYFQTFLVILYMLGAYLNRRAIAVISSTQLLSIGIKFCFAGGGCVVLCALLFPQSPWILTFAMSIYSFGAGISFANTSNQALSILPQARGSCAGLLSVVEMLCCALAVWIAGMIYQDSYIAVALCIWGCAGICLWIWKMLAPCEGLATSQGKAGTALMP